MADLRLALREAPLRRRCGDHVDDKQSFAITGTITNPEKGDSMAIQIFGTTKSFDTKKAERWFSERRVAVQVINLKEKSISKGELESVLSCLTKKTGSKEEAFESLIDKQGKEYSSIAYLDDSDKFDKLLDNPLLLKQPIVRNGKTEATVGYDPKTWENWL